MPQVSPIDMWRLPLILMVGLVTALLLIYLPTTISFVETWNSSETFAHGYLILPITLWLIWQNKAHYYQIQPSVNYYAIPLILLVSFVWLIAYFVNVNVIQQISLVALIILAVFGVLGWQVTKTAAFPLFFLIFAVPMGEALVPTLIEFTADFTVAMVQMTGIPIYREGTFFQLPTGNWSVVEACSGVRYLIASVTLGFLYAYLTYQSFYRRAAFIVAAIVVPIVANGLRAFMIVMIGHFSGMELATGVDHLIYGWVFFGLVIALMFYIGSFWREDEVKVSASDKNAEVVVKKLKPDQFLVAPVILLLAVSLLPVWVYTDIDKVGDDPVAIHAPNINGWGKTERLNSDWTPRYKNMDASFVQNYEQENESTDLFVGYYIIQRDNAQLVTSNNVLTEEEEQWANIGQTNIELVLPRGKTKVPLAHLKSVNKEVLVAYFYYLDGNVITNDYLAKLTEAKTRVMGGDRSSSIIAVSTELNEDRAHAISRIQSFVRSMGDEVFHSIENAGHVK